jgi:hypothetical protein
VSSGASVIVSIGVNGPELDPASSIRARFHTSPVRAGGTYEVKVTTVM